MTHWTKSVLKPNRNQRSSSVPGASARRIATACANTIARRTNLLVHKVVSGGLSALICNGWTRLKNIADKSIAAIVEKLMKRK